MIPERAEEGKVDAGPTSIVVIRQCESEQFAIIFSLRFHLRWLSSFLFRRTLEQVKIPMCRLDDVSTSGFVTRTATTRERGKNPLFPIQTDAISMAKYFRLARRIIDRAHMANRPAFPSHNQQLPKRVRSGSSLIIISL